MGIIRVGTCSWSDHQDFYPPGLPKAQQIVYYSRFFSVVEVDSTFYHPPSERNFALWNERTPPDFRFHVKAYGLFTFHRRGEEPTEDDFRRFASALEPIRKAGKLSAVLLQFPPWFHYGEGRLDYLLYVRRLWEDLPLAVEFRHRSWYRDDRIHDTLAFLQHHGFIHVVPDEPQVGEGSVPLVPAVTEARLSILRLHGRNRETWYKKTRTSGERFYYLYSQEELQELSQVARSLAERAEEVHVLFNNNYGSYAVTNARQMKALLEGRP